MKSTRAFDVILAALLLSAPASGARADVESEIAFQGTLSTPIVGETSVSGQFGFDFTNDTVTSYNFTAPGDASFDSSVHNDTTVTPFTSNGAPYLDIDFYSGAGSILDLNVNPDITEFFTHDLPVPPAARLSLYFCGNCSGPPMSTFASGAVSGGIPEPSTWAMMLLGFAGLGFAGYRVTRKAAPTVGGFFMTTD